MMMLVSKVFITLAVGLLLSLGTYAQERLLKHDDLPPAICAATFCSITDTYGRGLPFGVETKAITAEGYTFERDSRKQIVAVVGNMLAWAVVAAAAMIALRVAGKILGRLALLIATGLLLLAYWGIITIA